MRYKNPTPNPLLACEEGAYSSFRRFKPDFDYLLPLRLPFARNKNRGPFT
ncbi:MAG: hypothetical protein ACKO99_03480 [Dolichospermum sp.]